MLSPKTKEKRKKLASLSSDIRTAVKMGVYQTVNHGLKEMYKQKTNSTTFDTFNGWKEKGFSIKKGSEAFLIWGSPKKIKIDDSESEELKHFSFYPLCYLFSDIQVEKR